MWGNNLKHPEHWLLTLYSRFKTHAINEWLARAHHETTYLGTFIQ